MLTFYFEGQSERKESFRTGSRNCLAWIACGKAWLSGTGLLRTGTRITSTSFAIDFFNLEVGPAYFFGYLDKFFFVSIPVPVITVVGTLSVNMLRYRNYPS
jgi:hypothetical protein